MIDLEELNNLLARVDTVRQIKLSLAPDPHMPDPIYYYDLELELFELGTSRNVELVFRDVGELRVPVFGGLTQVHMLRVETNHPGHEQRYLLSEHEGLKEQLRFTCKSVELL